MEDSPPYCTGASDAPEPIVTTEDLVAAAHANRQGIPYETATHYSRGLPDKIANLPTGSAHR